MTRDSRISELTLPWSSRTAISCRLIAMLGLLLPSGRRKNLGCRYGGLTHLKIFLVIVFSAYQPSDLEPLKNGP